MRIFIDVIVRCLLVLAILATPIYLEVVLRPQIKIRSEDEIIFLHTGRHEGLRYLVALLIDDVDVPLALLGGLDDAVDPGVVEGDLGVPAGNP